MRVNVRLEVTPGIPLSDEAEDFPDECRLKSFSIAHQEEILKIIAELPSTSESDTKFEFPYQR